MRKEAVWAVLGLAALCPVSCFQLVAGGSLRAPSPRASRATVVMAAAHEHQPSVSRRAVTILAGLCLRPAGATADDKPLVPDATRITYATECTTPDDDGEPSLAGAPSDVALAAAAAARLHETRVARAARYGAGVDVSAVIGAGRILGDRRLPGEPLRRKRGKILPRARRRGGGRPRRPRGGNAITKTVRDASRDGRLADAPADARPRGDGRRPDAHIATVLGATVKTV